MRSDLKVKKKELSVKADQVTKLEKKIEALAAIKTELETKASELSNAQSQVEEVALLRTQFEEKDRKLSDAIEQISNPQEELDELEKLREQVTSKDSEIDNLKTSVQNLEGSLQTATNSATDLNPQLEKPQLDLADKDEQLAAAKSEFSNNKNLEKVKLEEDASKLVEKDKEIDNLKEKAEKVELLQNLFTTSETEVKRLKAESEFQVKAVEDLQKKVSDKVTKIAELNIDIKNAEEVRGQLEQMEGKLKEHQAELVTKSSEIEKLTEAGKVSEQRIIELEQSIKQPIEDVKTERENVEKIRTEHEVRVTELADSKSQLETKEAEIKQLRESSLQVESKGLQSEVEKESANDVIANKDLNEKIMDDGVEVSKAAQVNTSAVALEDLHKKITEKKELIDSLEKSKESIGKKKKKEKSDITTQIDQERLELVGLEKELEELSKKIEDQTPTDNSPPPKFEVLLVSPQHRTTELPKDLADQDSAEITEAQARETSAIRQVEKVDCSLTKLKMYIEKVFDHVVLLDIELREKNMELENMAIEIAELDRFKDCQELIVKILSRTLKSVEAIGKVSGVDATQEVNELAKDIEIIQKSARKIHTQSKNSSARDIILHDEPISIQVSSPTEKINNDASPRPVTREALEEELHVSESLADLQRDEAGKAHDISEKLVKVKMTNEKLTDNIAHLTNSISTLLVQLIKANDESAMSEGTISTLKNAMKVIYGTLNTGTEEMKKIAHDMSMSIQESGLSSPIKHADTPAESPDRHNFTGQSSTLSLITDNKTAIDRLNSEITHTKENRTMLESVDNSTSNMIKQLQQELKTCLDTVHELDKQISEKDDHPTMYQDVLDKVKTMINTLPGMQNLTTAVSNFEHLPVEPKTGSYRSLTSSGSRHSVGSHNSKDTEARKKLITREHPSILVNVAEQTPDAPEAINPEHRARKLKEDLDAALAMQSGGANEVHRLNEALKDIMLEIEKIDQNIVNCKTHADELTRDLKVKVDELSLDKENLHHRQAVLGLLEELLKKSKLIRGTSIEQEFAEAAIEKLSTGGLEDEKGKQEMKVSHEAIEKGVEKDSSEVKDKENELKESQSSYDKVKEELDEKSRTLSMLNQKIEKSRKEQANIESQLAQLNKELSEKADQLQASNTENTLLTARFSNLKADISKIESLFESVDNNADIYLTSLDKLKETEVSSMLDKLLSKAKTIQDKQKEFIVKAHESNEKLSKAHDSNEIMKTLIDLANLDSNIRGATAVNLAYIGKFNSS